MSEPECFEISGATALVWRDAPQWDDLRTAAIGGFTCSDAAAGSALLNEIAKRLSAEGFGALIGPMDGDTWHRYRVIVESDGTRPFALEPTSGEYDGAAFVAADFSPIADYVSSRGRLCDTLGAAPANLPGIVIEPWDGRDAGQFVHRLFEMSLAEFSRNRFFKPITRQAFLDLYQPVLPLIDPAHVLFAHGSEGLVGFLFGLPNRLEGAQPQTVVLKTYASRMRGVGHLLADTFHRRALAMGFADVIHALMHVDNISRERSSRYGTRVFRRYALMGRRLAAR